MCTRVRVCHVRVIRACVRPQIPLDAAVGGITGIAEEADGAADDDEPLDDELAAFDSLRLQPASDAGTASVQLPRACALRIGCVILDLHCPLPPRYYWHMQDVKWSYACGAQPVTEVCVLARC